MKLITTIVFILLTTNLYALSQDNLLHDTAHFGATYTITDVSEVVCRRITSKSNKLVCTLIGMNIANTANIAYKARQHFPSDTKRALVSGALGAITAALVITLDF